jgi:uncharacterized SAM-binding protein YcdF (DUF218 family)
VNSLLVLLGIESWKPVIAAFLLPPVPLLVMVLIGARLMLPRRGLGWSVILIAVALLWLSACLGAAQSVSRFMLHPPPALSFERIKELRAEAQARRSTAIVVLGGGMEPYAPEYGVSSLSPASLERLRYGLWLGRETGLPVAFSGGVGHAQATDATPEAEVAAKVAAEDFGRPLKWVETESRDTRENALRSVPLLRKAGIDHIILVTHGWHMPRALRAFREAGGDATRVEAAPMGLAKRLEASPLPWIPSMTGFSEMNHVLHELAGLAVGG